MVEDPDDAVRAAFGDDAPLVARVAPCLALTDDHGIVRAALDPPFPPAPFVEWGDRFRLDASWFDPPSTHRTATLSPSSVRTALLSVSTRAASA